jgi:hypothetical protein
MAVTAAIASGVKLPSSREVASASPRGLATQDTLLKLLDECVAVSVSTECHFADGPMIYEVEYLHSPGIKKNADTLMIDGYTKNMRPVNVQYGFRAGDLPRLTVRWA